jgi:hypothetical protein
MSQSEFAERIKTATEKSPFLSILLLLVFVVVGLLIGNAVAVAIVMLVTGVDMYTIQEIASGSVEHPQTFTILLILQGVALAFTMIGSALAFLSFVEKKSFSDLNDNPYVWALPAMLTVLIVIVFMPFDALIIEWNQHMDLPPFLDELEKQMQASEAVRSELTKKLTDFRNVPQLLAGLFVIGLIPAIGEELVFRGLIQSKLIKMFGNVHVGVWAAGFIFSFIHFQFYGFVPRMLLGVLFGYLYVWSGNIWYPIIGHFTNNGFTLVMYYLYQKKTVGVNIDDTASVSLRTTLISFAVLVFLLYIFKSYFTRYRTSQYE